MAPGSDRRARLDHAGVFEASAGRWQSFESRQDREAELTAVAVGDRHIADEPFTRAEIARRPLQKDAGHSRLAFDQLTFMPNERWSWAVGYWYLRNGVDGFTTGADYVTTTAFYRLDDNWGLRATENFNAEDGRLQQQYYTVYRDMRSWTAALTFRAE